MDVQLAGESESGMSVKTDIPFHAEKTDTPLTRLFERIVQQFQPITLAFEIGMDADWAESPGGNAAAILQQQLRLRKHDVSDDASILFHYKIQFWNKVGVVSESVEHKMLRASRTINVPERFAGEVFNIAVVLWLLQSDMHISWHLKFNAAKVVKIQIYADGRGKYPAINHPDLRYDIK